MIQWMLAIWSLVPLPLLYIFLTINLFIHPYVYMHSYEFHDLGFLNVEFSHIQMYVWRDLLLRNWLTKLESLKSLMIYQWPAQDLGMPVMWFSVSAKASDTGEKMMRMRSNKAENGCPSSVIRHRGPNSSFLHPFAVLRPLIDWMMPTHTGDKNYLTNSTNSNANFIQKHPHRHTQK